MGERLTPLWTPTTAQAYGASGERGRLGEVYVINILRENNIQAIDFEEEKQQQIEGVDIETDQFTIDVKTNLKRGEFFIETGSSGWLFHPRKTSDIILHVDPQTSNIVWYRRAEAQSKIRKTALSSDLIRITQHNFRPDFMSSSWDDLFNTLRC